MDFSALIDWITQNPEWAYWIIFLIAFLESLAIVGILVPGWLLLVGVGVMVGTGTINYLMASFYCFLGAVIGEYISFAIGKHYQDRVRQWRVFTNNPHWLTKTDHFFERFGVASIALGRFVGPVRAFVPLIAGMSSMPLIRFQIINVASAAIWAPLYLVPGVIIGASTQLEGESSKWLIANLVLIIIAGWMAMVYLRNWWRVKQHDTSQSFDNNALGIKLLVLISITLTSITYLFVAPHSELFFSLVDLMISIVTNTHAIPGYSD